MLMRRSISIFGVTALILALAACQKESEVTEKVTPSPDYDPETNTVKTTFVLNVSTETGKDTKTTAEYVQYKKPFLGMSAVHLLTYSLGNDNYTDSHGHYLYRPIHTVQKVINDVPTEVEEAVAATRDYNLGDLFGPNAVDAENASRTIELSLPLGTNAVLLYGKATKTVGDDLQGKVDITGNPANITSLEFSLQPRLSSMGAYNAGAFFFSSMMTSFLSSGLVDERQDGFWNHATGTKDRSYKIWWPIPSAADQTALDAIIKISDESVTALSVDQRQETVNGTEYTCYAGMLSWKQLGRMYDYQNDGSDATDPSDFVYTAKGKANNGAALTLSPLCEVLGDAYSVLTTIKEKGSLKELRAGSATAVLRTMRDLYAVVEKCATADPTGWEEVVAKELANQIRDRMNNFFEYDSNSVLDFLKTDSGDIDLTNLKKNLELNCSPVQWNANKGYINTYFDETYFYVESDSKATTVVNQGFPVNVGLPKGAAIMTATIDKADMSVVDQFGYTTEIPAYGFGQATFPIQNYRYPAELIYYGNSSLRVSNAVVAQNKYPSSIDSWNKESQWQDADDRWVADATVKSDTRSVAMVNNINYGTALLQSTVTSDAVLKDNRHNLFPLEQDQEINMNLNDPEKGIFVTGIIVGGQADVVGWDLTRRPLNPEVRPTFDGNKFSGWVFTQGTGDNKKSNEFDKMIYDKVTTSYKVGSTTEPIYTMVWDNYDATKGINDQSDVYVGVELVNKTDQDFWGELNLIRKGGTFYLLGKLDLSVAVEAAQADNPGAFTNLDRGYYCYPPYDPATGNTVNAPRVFMQDYMTKAKLNLGTDCLKHAYVTVPDLRSSQISLGLSIDMSWTAGLAFDVELGDL